MKIQWNGLHLSASGYGEFTRYYARVLRDAGHDLRLCHPARFPERQDPNTFAEHRMLAELAALGESHADPDLTVECSFYQLEVPRGRGKRVGQVMYETDRLPKRYAALCNAADGVMVPGPWGLQQFKKSGVTVPLRAVPYGLYELPERARPQGEVFRFISVFEWTDRKNPRALLSAYCNEFKAGEPVELVVKTGPRGGQWTNYVRRGILQKSGALNHPPISVVERTLPREQALELYHHASCCVSAHCAEGFGLPMFEAQARGLPVIATDYSESTWFVTEDTGYPVPWKKTEAELMRKYLLPGDYESSMWWADVDEVALRAAMRRAYENKEEARQKGEEGRRRLFERFTPEATARAFGELFREIGL